MEETNRVMFSVTPSRVKNSVAILSYLIITEPEEGCRDFACVLTHVTWNDGAGQFFRQSTVREVPVLISYRRGYIPAQFEPWQGCGCAVKDISTFDVSFEKFWVLYGHKVGNKAGVEKKWGKLSWEEKILALGSIPRIRKYYEAKGFEMPYPETYINQRRWENIFE